MASLRRCEVVWLDAHSGTEQVWHSLDDAIEQDAVVVVTRGFLMPDAKPNHVTVASSLTSDGDVSDVTCIPIGMVRALEVE